jgi:hypothetical protein
MNSFRNAKHYFRPLVIRACVSTCICFCSFRASTQFIFTPTKHVVTNWESIDKYERSQLKDSIPYTNILIIDSRYDTTGLGFFLDGYLALSGISMQAGLQQVMDKFYHPLCLAGRDTLIIQLEKLSIQDKIIKDTGFILTAGYVKARLYKGRNNSYTYIGTVDSMYKEKYDPHTIYDVHRNGKHFNYDFWDFYLLRLYEAIIKNASALKDSIIDATNQNFTQEEIKENGLTKRDKPILKADSLQPGFYRDFSEFVNNNPTFKYENRDALKNVLEVMHYRVGKKISNEEPDTSYWGFCVGRRIFVRHLYSFYQLERKDGGFYVSPTFDARRRDINRSALNLLIGLAALTGSIAANTSPEFGGFGAIPAPDIPLIILPGKDYLIVGLQLDWDTGGIIY